jgi:hypothetical protein
VADNYLQFSEQLPISSKREEAWLRAVLKDGEDRKGRPHPDALWDEDWGVGFSWKIEGSKEERSLWIYAEESGNVEKVADMVVAFLRKFRPEGSFALGWSETCSKPRFGEFGGGAMFVTAKGAEFLSSINWLHQKEIDWESKSKRQRKARKAKT